MTYTFKGYADQKWTWPHFKVPCSLSSSVYCGLNLWLLKCQVLEKRKLATRYFSLWTCFQYCRIKFFLPCVVTTVFSFPVLALLQSHRWTFQLLYSPTVQLKLRFLSTRVCGNKAPISTCIFSTLSFIHFLWYCWKEFVQTSRHIIFVVHVINSHGLYLLQGRVTVGRITEIGCS